MPGNLAPGFAAPKRFRGSGDLRGVLESNWRYLTGWLNGNINDRPLGVLAYAEVTTGQGPITTVTQLTGLSITINVNPGRYIRLSATAQVTWAASSSGVGRFRESSTNLGRWARHTGTEATTYVHHGAVILSPSAGEHTYNLSLEASAGSGTMQSDASVPAFIMAEDIGGI